MSVTVINRVGTLANLPLSDRALMHEVGLLVRERIIRRTLAGQSVDGGPFKPYSEGYRAWKAQQGGSGTPNLQLSGRMLNDIAITETENSVTLDFKS